MPARSIGSRCNGACFCAARSYNRGEPQGAANSPRLSNRFGGLASCYGSLSLRIGSRSIIAVKNPSKLEANSRIAAIKAKTVMASTSLLRSLAREHRVERGVVPRRLCASYLLVLRPRITRRWRASSADLPRSRALSTRFQRGFHISCQCFQHSLSVRLAWVLRRSSAGAKKTASRNFTDF